MGIVAIDIIEDSFVIKNSPSYNLSVLVSTDRFSYAIADDANHLLAIKSYTFDSSNQMHKSIQDVFIDDTVLTLPYKKIVVGVSNHISTLIPNNLFEENKMETYLKAQTDQLSGKTVQQNSLKSLDAKNVFAFDKEIMILLKGYLPNASYYHASSALLEGAIHTAPNDDSSKIYLNIHSKTIQIVLMSGSKLIFSNSFSYLSSKDLLYYVMLIYNQFKLSPIDIPLVISGHILEDSEIYKVLFRYVNIIELNNTLPSIILEEKSRSSLHHFFFDLFSLRLCGL